MFKVVSATMVQPCRTSTTLPNPTTPATPTKIMGVARGTAWRSAARIEIPKAL